MLERHARRGDGLAGKGDCATSEQRPFDVASPSSSFFIIVDKLKLPPIT